MSGRQSKVEKEREKVVQDRMQAILTAMLKVEEPGGGFYWFPTG
jgi:hypothetical protein